MSSMKRTIICIAAVAALAACDSFSDQDRAMLSSANQNAAQAKQIAQQALDASQTAQANAAQANEKADRMFQQSLRK